MTDLMLQHWQGIDDLVRDAGYANVHHGFADVVSSQYVVLFGKPWDGQLEAALANGGDFAAEIRVKGVTGTVDGVVIMLNRLRGHLDETAVAVAGRTVVLHWQRSEFVDVDQSVLMPGTNRHPAFGVDTYLLTSEPT